MTWVLWLWIAASPDTMTPLGWYADSAACVSARRREVTENVRAGSGGGATYVCIQNANEPRASTALRGK